MGNGNGIVDAAEYHRRAKDSEQTIDRLRAERDQLDYAIEAWSRRHTEIMAAADKAGVAELAAQGVRRSLMTAKQKSEAINRLGRDGYNALPW